MLRFRQTRTLQKFASVHVSVDNHFNQERAFYSRQNFKSNRAAGLVEWRLICSAGSDGIIPRLVAERDV